MRHCADFGIDVWFHRYEDGRDIEGRFDYNSWQESDVSKKLAATLDRDVILAEGMRFGTAKPGRVTLTSSNRIQGIQDPAEVHGSHGRLAREQGLGDPS